MAKPTEDVRVYRSGKHWNGSRWIVMSKGVFWNKGLRVYQDEDGKPSDFSPYAVAEAKAAKEAEAAEKASTKKGR